MSTGEATLGAVAGLADERRTMGRWSGALWLLGAAVGAAGQALPGVEAEHPWLVWALCGLLGAYGLACLLEWIPWGRAPIGAHLAAVLAFQPVLALALWATGGAASYITPLLVLAMLYAAYFLPGWMAWVGVGALALTYASTLLYTPVGEDQALARVLAFAISCEGVTLSLQTLKRRLLAAEAAQREMAHADALTGLANRRGFDAALAGAVAAAGAPDRGRRALDPGRFALLLIDVDHFKAINDTYGHTAGDAVLRRLAAGISGVVRPQDCVARIGGDELAIVAPGAGEDGARRLAQAVRVAAARVRPAAGAAPVSLTVAWAVHPDDGDAPADLFAAVDRGLHAGKQAGRAPSALPSPS
ncbi:MAG: GGDEF domain-containing protein [Solirubrobacteraceae bacterium]|nr:GGDEF domain-containing protein [Solirubrobacteraceae bacterium]